MNHEKTLTTREFKKFRQLIYEKVGIALADSKRTLVQSRLRKWLVKFNLPSYEMLYKKIADDTSEQMLILLVNAITTNVTSFFREENQWIYLQENMKELFDYEKKRIRIWSAACSSGQEPYSIIMFLHEHLDNFDEWDIKILATDISEEILQKAQKGVYSEQDIANMPRNLVLKNFTKEKNHKGVIEYAIREELKQYIIFRSFNLVTGNFTLFHNKFDMIFCRNVMIYFDNETRGALFEHFARLLHEKSRLFIGHSESIQKNNNIFRVVVPSIYRLN